MGHSAQPPQYKWLAQYYDLLFSSFRSPMDVARQRILGSILPAITSACDLACGTGVTALALARQGIRMFAVDLSPAMCRITRDKAKRAGRAIDVIRADMRKFRLPQPVDLITCEFDALNHIPQKKDLALVARCVARALKPDGYFFFDVNNQLGFKQYWRGAMWLEQPGAVFVMRNANDFPRDRAWSDIEMFVKQGSLWKRHSEHVDEVCWSKEEIHHTFAEAGFSEVRSWDAAPFFAKEQPIIKRGCRTIYLARARGSAGTRT